MYFVSLYMDGTEWLGRTEILTRSATDATALVDGWELYRVLVVLIHRNHHNGTRRTVASTVAALRPVGEDNAVLLRPDCMTYLNARLVFLLDRFDGTSRTNLTASVTFWSAVATLIRHGRLHQLHQVSAWSKYVVRTLSHAELASRTMLRHILCRKRTWRSYRCSALERLLLSNGSKTAIHLLLLLGEGGRGCYCCSRKEEVASAAIEFFTLHSSFFT